MNNEKKTIVVIETNDLPDDPRKMDHDFFSGENFSLKEFTGISNFGFLKLKEGEKGGTKLLVQYYQTENQSITSYSAAYDTIINNKDPFIGIVEMLPSCILCIKDSALLKRFKESAKRTKKINIIIYEEGENTEDTTSKVDKMIV